MGVVVTLDSHRLRQPMKLCSCSWMLRRLAEVDIHIQNQLENLKAVPTKSLCVQQVGRHECKGAIMT